MSDIVSKVTPLTRGIIWLTQGDIRPDSLSYKAIDYLVDGLLTASLKARPGLTSRVVLGKNFGHPLHVFIGQELEAREFESFLKLLSKDLSQESNILVIDEADSFKSLLKHCPSDIQSRLHLSRQSE